MKKIFKPFRKIIPHLKNKYILSVLVFIIWVSFFDKNDFLTQYNYRKQLHQLTDEQQYYLTEIEQNKKELNDLMSSPQNLEKYSREKYLMKKDDEDIFVIVQEKPYPAKETKD